MTFLNILETLLIGPLKLIFEIIFEAAYRFVGHRGLAIIFLSLIMNLLVLPLYRRADAMQEEVRNKEAKIRDGAAHIKKTFSGDERMMILQTYYRQNHYKPTDALRGSVSLLLEIPFFMAAYQFLSHLDSLQEVSFGPIRDLGAPDGLLSIGGVSINLLPILMTLVNVVSSTLYLKGFPLKTKIQLYGMALLFLVFLYPSPAGLVFYWTLNNVFSLGKNIFYKLKNPKKILRLLCAAVSLILFGFAILIYHPEDAAAAFPKRVLMISVGLLLLLPALLPVLKKSVQSRETEKKPQQNAVSQKKHSLDQSDNSEKKLRILCSAVGFVMLIFGIVTYFIDIGIAPFQQKAAVIGGGFLFLLSVLIPLLKKSAYLREIELRPQPNQKLFVLGTVFLTILIGLLIPSALIADSPQDFVDITYFHHPFWYVVSAFCLAAGTFFIWVRVFYWLAGSKIKRLFENFIWISCGLGLINYMFFGTDLGIITSTLRYEGGMNFTIEQLLFNFWLVLLASVVLYICACKWKRAAANVLTISIAAVGMMSVWNSVKIKTSVDKIAALSLAENETPHFRLSTTGKNVIVLMLDRSMGGYIPYIFNEKPELTEKFDGFTYYENTMSHGGYTNFTTPSLLGGYEYTPIEMNKRKDESLVSKHNEALKVMPVIFSENGYEVTVCDPPYANYGIIPDLSIYDDCQGVAAYITKGQIHDEAQKQESIQTNHRNIFCFSLMKSMPLIIQPSVYDAGNYFKVKSRNGVNIEFLDSYNVLVNLPDITEVTEEETNTFLFLDNELTHTPIILQEPDYTPNINVDNNEYDAGHTDRYSIDGRKLGMEDYIQISEYHVNMAAMIQLGNWFDYLRENNTYDNTRIILVSDHGRGWGQIDDLIFGDDTWRDVEHYYPLFMVKDFNSKGFKTSDTFMTNADVPTLAMQELIENPQNPFTGKVINNDEKTAHDQFVIISVDWRTDTNKGNTFLPASWAKVSDNIWDKNNWTFYDVSTVLDEYAAP